MSIFTRLLTGLAVGAAGMYFLDPQQGKRRRALLRDQWTHLKTQTPKRVESKMRHLQNQAQGLMHEFQGGFGEGRSQSSENRDEEIESQASRMQSAARGASAEAGEKAFGPKGAGSADGQMHQQGHESTRGPGEAGERAPSRQPNTRQTMDL